MSHVICAKHICRISDGDFWSALQAPREETVLSEAIRLGRAGKKSRAYARLGDHHRRTLAHELSVYRRQLFTMMPRTAQTAEDLLRHRIVTWHTTIVDFGPEIDWNYAQTDQYGFHYLGWLGAGTQRVLETGEAVYRDCLLDIVTSYYQARNRLDHPLPPMHLVYGELGAWAKTRALLPLYLGLLDTGDLPTEAHEAFLKLFLGFGRALYDLAESYHSGNWQIAGCSAMLTLARAFPEFTESNAWEQRALHYLKAHLEDDFYPDGGHKERCWGYGFMSVSAITNAFQLALRQGGLGADERWCLRRIRQAYRWFAHTLGPTELSPAFGDDELGSGSRILDAAKPLFPAETDRYLGVDRTKSVCLKPSGFAIMRNGDAPDAGYLNLSFGQFAGWHSHMDCLSLNFWALGQPLLEEVGRFGGYGEALTIFFRAAESHNQLTIDGMHYDCVDHNTSGARVTGCGWEGHPDFANRAGRDPVWHSTPAADFFTAWHGAYCDNWREPQTLDLRIRRTVIFVKEPGYVLVSDVAWEPHSNNEGPNFSVTQNWHSPFPFQALAPAVARTLGDPACLLAFAPQPYLRRLETGADFAGEEAPVEKAYPERHYLRARRWLPVEHRGATGVTVALYPFRGEAPAVSVETLPLDGIPLFRGGAFVVTTPHGRDLIVINPDRLPGVTFEGNPVPERCRLRLDRGRGNIVIK